MKTTLYILTLLTFISCKKEEAILLATPQLPIVKKGVEYTVSTYTSGGYNRTFINGVMVFKNFHTTFDTTFTVNDSAVITVMSYDNWEHAQIRVTIKDSFVFAGSDSEQFTYTIRN
jgi:hypothetical protein